MSRVALHTFGCRINQYETQAMGEALARAGFAIALDGERADIHIVNSCTVTATSDRDCRRLVRSIVRADPLARVVVAGCYAQRAPAELAALPGVALVAGHAAKARIADHCGDLPPRGARALVVAPPAARRAPFDETPIAAPRRTRALVKIQDGCDGRCGFCVIPSVRGGSRSRPAAAILAEVERLVGAGALEVVLTGVHLGSWHDPTTGERLDRLVERVLDVRGLRRLRLSSLEPQHLTDRLLDLVASPRLMPFFHLPLQSGDDATLRRMRRGYGTRQFAERVERLVARRPDAGVGSDILVGYPGEDAASFERSLRFIASMPFTRLHVFPFSPREGTEGAAVGGVLPDAATRERCARVRSLGAQRADAFRRRFVGARAELLVERTPTREGRLVGYTGNYLRAEIGERADLASRIVPVTLYDGPRGLVAVPEAA
jgi:threonylcarbamoyladenosine tRNA methylthiotransferase MtaB